MTETAEIISDLIGAEQARIVLARIEGSNLAIADLSTHVIVPREPTDEMLERGASTGLAGQNFGAITVGAKDDCRDIYRAMINHKDSVLADEPKPKTWPARKPNWQA